MPGIILDNEKNIVIYLNKIHVHVELDSKWKNRRKSNYFLFYLHSDISFLCEATTALVIQEQQNKSHSQQRTTDKSAIRAIPHELQQEPVCYLSLKKQREIY